MDRSRIVLVLAVAGLLVLAGCSSSTAGTSAEPADTALASETEDGSTATSTVEETTTNGTVEVHFINVGQSVATLVVGPTNETMLIDTGDFTNDGEYVLQYLREQSVERIDHLVVSHNDADHIGGNAAIIDYYETEAEGIGAIYDPGIAASTQTYEAYLDAVEAHDVTLYETRENDTIPFEGVETQVLGPPEPYLENEARNENSIVVRLSYGSTSFLFTGDAEDDQEEYLVENYGAKLDSTVLKAGHHGSRTSTSGQLLDAVEPKAVVVSSASDSQYGHPHEETLDRLDDRSIPTFWTATHGNTVMESNGENVTVRTQQAAPTDPASLREGEPIEPGATDPLEHRTTLRGGSENATPTPTATDSETDAETRTTATDGGTSESPTSGTLAVAEVHADAAGDEYDNLNDEYVVFENSGDEPLDLSGWQVEDEAGHSYTFPDGFTLDPGATVTLHTGSGTDSETDLYWGSGSPIWNNGGDTVVVTNAEGERVRTEEYS